MSSNLKRPSPGLVIAFLALLVALTGSAIATTRPAGNPSATTAAKKFNKKQVKKIKKLARKQANKRINKRAGGLNVNSAKTAGTADNATSADSAKSADSATSAQTATNAQTAANAQNAQTAANADALGGLPPDAFQRQVRWAHVGVSGGDPSILGGSGGMTIVSGGAMLGHQDIDVGEDVSDAAILVTATDETSVLVAGACSQSGTTCDGGNNGDPTIVRVQAFSADTGNPITAPRPYYLAIIS